MLQSLDMRDEIILDTASSTSLFGNTDYVAGIQESNGTLELHTNGGSIVSSKTASVDRFGKVWYNKDSVANNFIFAEMQKLYRITTIQKLKMPSLSTHQRDKYNSNH
jgi:hypothetical protein